MSKMSRVQVRMANDFAFNQVKLNLDDFKTMVVYDDEVFGFYKNDYVSIKRCTLPKNFELKK